MDGMFLTAHELGMDHAEQSLTEPVKRLLSGRQVALALGLDRDLTGDEYVGLFDSYNSGWSDFW